MSVVRGRGEGVGRESGRFAYFEAYDSLQIFDGDGLHLILFYLTFFHLIDKASQIPPASVCAGGGKGRGRVGLAGGMRKGSEGLNL